MNELEIRLQEFENWRNHFEWNYLKDRYAPCRVLDFGCGYGYGSVYLAANGFDVVGYDIDEGRIEIAQSLRWMQTDLVQDRIWFSSKAIPALDYDLVWMSHVLEHIPLERWSGIFGLLPKCPILVSVPLGHAYDNSQHIHHWKDENDLTIDLTRHSSRTWSACEYREYSVIRAIGVI